VTRVCSAAALCTLIAATSPACVLSDVSLDGRRCPCAEGWRCDEARDVCVPGSAAPVDAGADAAGDAGSSPDAGDGRDGATTMDADTPDAGPVPTDGGPGTPDAGTDAGTDAGPDSTICDELVGVIFCDGFEDGFAHWGWRTETAGTVTAGTSTVYRGAAALYASTTDLSGKASITSELGTTVSSGALYVRAYVYVPSSVVSTGISFLFVGEAVAPYAGIAFEITGAGRASVYIGPLDREAAGAHVPMPRDRWVCATLTLDVGDTGRARAAIDGVSTVDEALIDVLPAGGLSRVTTGIEWSSPTQMSADVYVDEVVVSTSPIPCD